LNERFTQFADLITEAVGKWWFTVVSLILLIAWIIYGIVAIPGWFTSAAWNFPANSITTLGEWFMEGLILAAANRVERRNTHLLECLLSLIQKVDTVVEKEEQELASLANKSEAS
jgi:uncharacterized membrane protein